MRSPSNHRGATLYARFLLSAASFMALGLILRATDGLAQQIPDVRCQVEDYPIGAPLSWQSTEALEKVQVVVLRDPAGEQEARFDLTHGATLISLSFRKQELLYAHGAGANVSMYVFRHGTEEDLKGLSPYWSVFHPDQGGSSMGVPSTTAGVACHGTSSMRAFAMMVDSGVNSSFQREPLLGVWKGRVSRNFPPGYSTPYSIETDASWVANRGRSPQYYLRLDQTIVRLRPGSSGPMEWFLEGASPWDFQFSAKSPENCQEKSPCSSADVPAVAMGRYADAARSEGFATVVPTVPWAPTRVRTLDNSEYAVLAYGAVWSAPRHLFATVLTHTMEGVGGFRVGWYVCAGNWDAARSFASTLGH
jgi:hypothetical protein